MASCDRRIHCSSIFVVVSLLLLFFSQAIEANVFVPSHDKVFESNPALLGKAWSSSTLAEGRLQFLVENPKLCSLSGNESPVLFFENDEQDNLPLLTLLIERGDCKFSQKVAAATSWSNGAVKYIIVYDNEDGELMDMTGKTSEDVGLLFVSLSTGKQLREILLEQNTNQTTGLWIQMDGKRPISQHSHIKNKMKTTFNRLLLALSVSDIVVSAAWFFSTWALPKKAPPGIDQEYYEYEFPYTAGSIGTCSAQGFFVQLGSISSVLFTSFIAIQFVLRVRYKLTDTQMKQAEKYFFAIGTCIPLVFAIALVSVGAMNPTYAGFCWIQISPWICDFRADLQTEFCSQHVNRGEKWFIYRLLMATLWIALALSIVIVSMGLMYITVRHQEQRAARWPAHAQEGRQQKLVVQTASLYIGSFMFVWIPTSIAMFFNFRVEQWENIIIVTILPLHGLLNALVYAKKMSALGHKIRKSKAMRRISQNTSKLINSASKVLFHKRPGP